MIKALKIFAWTLLSGLLLTVAAVAMVCYIIVTPERLTPIVRQVADEFITCEYEIGEVDLTFFSTFPYAGVEIQDLSLIHPVDSTVSDTLAAIKKMVVELPPLQALRGDIYIKRLIIEDLSAHLYTAADGRTNYDVLSLPDTIETEEDTTDGWKIQSIGWEEDIRLTATTLSYQNEKDSLYASLKDASITLSNIEKDTLMGAQLDMSTKHLSCYIKGEKYADDARVQLRLPILINENFYIDNALAQINEFALSIDGEMNTPCLSSGIYNVDIHVQTEPWQIKPLLALVPPSFTHMLKGINIDGQVGLELTAKGTFSDTQMPHVTAHLSLSKGKGSYQALPYTLRNVHLDATADIDLNNAKPSTVVIHKLSAQTKQSAIRAKGTIDDLMGNMLLDISLTPDVHLPDFAYFLPDSMQLSGKAKGNVTAKIHIDNLLAMRIDKGLFDAQLDLTDVHYAQDSLEAHLPMARATIIVPNKQASRKQKQPSLSAAIELQAEQAHMAMGDDLDIKAQQLHLTAAARHNVKADNLLQQWNPRLTVVIGQGQITAPDLLPETVYIPSIDFSYSNRKMAINDAKVLLGQSDLALQGSVRNIAKWFRHKGVLEGELNIVSNHCNANQLLSWFSADEPTDEESDTQEPDTSTSTQSEKDSTTIAPFIVPTDVNLALNTHIHEIEVFDQVATDLKGGLYIHDGTVILEEMGFVCRAAKLQLTAMYRSPRANHLYVGLDYHMIDVDIDELINMIPNLEQMVPMLSSFKGQAEFHLAAETYLNNQYQPKMSTLRGAASLTGKDLVVLDGETFSKISKLLLFNKKTENKIDSINAEMTIYKNQIDIYPLCVQMDNYMVALGGRHNTNMTFNYDINVLKPIYLGVNVSGNMDDLQIKLAKCKFAEDFRPRWYQKVDTQSLELRQRIKQSMERNVRIQSTK